ncbi:UBP-type zinc finger domain-containing protein [Williamsia maris]|nr:UBP-type zinc finger domain-containing protein [Williamsia maris]
MRSIRRSVMHRLISPSDVEPEGCDDLRATAADPADDPMPGPQNACQGCAEEGVEHWAHLRRCLSCGYIGCCDSSPRKHATAHHKSTHHPVMRSAEPGETWRWCYVHAQLG